jgi:site-specific DNA recombinase
MKKRAILYIRVSTDEQADKGYSLAHQRERLEKYCELQGYEVVALYNDDHSAKSFEPPQFKKLLEYVKKNKNKADLLIFTKWDRFSRNAGDAYGMINTLRKFGVEPQAIEQPLDLTVPENKLMLAFYLAAPEVENDRRALNIISGIRKAQREGRVCNSALVGYKNIRNERGMALVEIDEKASKQVIWCFKKLAEGGRSVEDVRKEAQRNGLQLSSAHFHRFIRNPFYYGVVRVPKHDNFEEHLVKGLHKPLITKELFDRVQSVLDGRKRDLPAFEYQKDIYPLRGYLQCKLCGRVLTASASTGKMGTKFHYYHCQKGCRERIKVATTNDQVEEILQETTALEPTAKILGLMLKDFAKENQDSNTIQIKQIDDQIKKLKARMDNAQTLMLDGEFSLAQYKTMKANWEADLESLLSKKMELPDVNTEKDKFISFILENIENLGKAYTSGNVREKQLLLSSIFEENLIFDEKKYRTPKFNKILSLLFSLDKGLRKIKNGKEQMDFVISRKVESRGVEPLSKHIRQKPSTCLFWNQFL